jgi:hypothetical protein
MDPFYFHLSAEDLNKYRLLVNIHDPLGIVEVMLPFNKKGQPELPFSGARVNSI